MDAATQPLPHPEAPVPDDGARASRPPGSRRLRALLWLLLGLDGALLVALWCGGPAGLLVFGARLLPGYVESALPLAVALLVTLGWLRLGSRRVALRAWVQWRRRWAPASPPRRLALLASLAMLAVALDDLVATPKDALRLRLVQAASSTPSLTHNRHNRHVPGLVAAVTARPDAGPLVVHLDDDDARGHEAAYYAYPRLLLMAPARRAWSLRARMDHLGLPDPAPPPSLPEPPLGVSRAFAHERGLPLLVWDRHGLSGPSPDPTGRP